MIALLALAAALLSAQDTVGVAVQLSQQRVAAGEVVVYDVTITTPGGAPDDIRLPQFAGLQLEGTRRYDEYAIRFPGGRVRTTRVEVHLRPRSPGRYAIPPVIVVYDGRRFASRSLTLDVVDAGSARTLPGMGTPDVEGFSRSAVGPDAEALLRARLEPDTVWVGQQATLVVEALVSQELRARLRRAPEYLTPAVAGMWTQDLPDVMGTHVEWSGPRRYEVQTFRRAYFPLEQGRFIVPEARLLYEARRGFLFTPYSEELYTPPLTLVVLPLPDSGVPESYTGAVGDYSISATIAPANLAVGDAALLTVVVRGAGNLKSLPAPRIPDAPVTLDSPTEDANIDPVQGIVSGTKTFTWVVVPEQSGIVQIGPIEYGYFDPDAGDYRVARTGILSMDVAPADPGSGRQNVALEALAPLRTRARPDPFAGLRGVAGAALALAPLLLGGLFLGVRRSRARARALPSQRSLTRRLHVRLDDIGAAGAIEQPRFFEDVGAAARDWLGDRLAAPELRGASGAGLSAGLERAGVPATLAGATRDLLDRVARAPFQPAPPTLDERRRMLERVRETLDRVDRVAPALARSRGRAAGTVASVALLALLALVASGAHAQAAARPTLDAIASANAAGRAVEAANLARDYVQAAPRDASGWYDLGTVEASRGNRGIATWALLRALALDPRAADVRHNLDVLGVDDAARRAAAPAVPLRPGEARAAALAAWWLAVLLGVVAIARRSRGWTLSAATAGAAAVLLGALVLGPSVAPDSAVPFAADSPLRAAPHLRAPTLRPAGSSALRIVERRDDWLRVRDADGDEGWIERRDVGII